MVLLIASHHQGFPLYVLTAATGSTIGVFFLDLVARKLGEASVEKMAGKKRFETLRKKGGSRAGAAIVTATLLPPSFLFTIVVATASALNYSRVRLLIFNWLGRALRFTIVGFVALEFGHEVIRVAQSKGFRYTMIGFVVLCFGGSAFSIWNWVRHTRPRRKRVNF